MKRTWLLLFTLLVIGCSGSGLNQRLNRVESLLDTRPAEALATLDSIAVSTLRNPKDRARFGLLKSMALDKNFIDVGSDSILAPAVAWYSRHGDALARGRMHYCLGRIRFNSGDYAKAAVSFTESVRWLEKTSDEFQRGLALRMIATANTFGYMETGNLPLLEQARDCFLRVGKTSHALDTDILIGIHYNNTSQWVQADSCFRAIEASAPADTALLAKCLKSHARMLANRDNPDYPASFALFQRAFLMGASPTPTDALAYSVAAYAVGEKESALVYLEQVGKRDEYAAQTNNTRYRIAMMEGRWEEAVRCQELAYRQQDSVVFAALRQSVAMAQRDYFAESAARLDEKIKSQRLMIVAQVLLLLLCGAVAWLLRSRHEARHEAEVARLSGIAAQTQVLLNEAELRKDSYKAKYIEKFKGQFATLRQLAEESLKAEGLNKPNEYLLKKLSEMVRLIRDDKEGHSAFEAMLNRDLDQIMQHIREDYPGKRESTYRMISYLIAGFDATSISLLLGVQVESVYVRKSQILEDLRKVDSPHKEQYLDFMS